MVTFYRRLPRFDYVKPKSIGEALALLEGNKGGEMKIFAGGTDVLPRLKKRLIAVPRLLIDLKGISELEYVEHDEADGLRIGALAGIFSVANAAIVKKAYPILSQAAGSIASRQVQNRGTIVGNICNAVPSADSAPALLCLGAEIVCLNKSGERTVKAEDFFTGPSRTVLGGGEMVKEIRVPKMPETSKGVYLKLSPRSKMDLAVVGVGVVVMRDGGAFRDVRIGLGAVAPTPMRAKRAEALLAGAKIHEDTIAKAAKAAAEESRPIDDHRASAEYRRMMVEVLVRRGIQQCLSA
jgi:CO/xanthine dehydrogenase FAD-binding subunit